MRPLNSMEKSINGYSRCLKQESSQCVAWTGQPETRFLFDHVACETIDQVRLKSEVENFGFLFLVEIMFYLSHS